MNKDSVATKKDIEILKNGNNNLRSSVKKDIETLKKDNKNLRSSVKKDIETLKKDNNNLRSSVKKDIETLKKDNNNLRISLKKDLDEFRNEMFRYIGVVQENFQDNLKAIFEVKNPQIDFAYGKSKELEERINQRDIEFWNFIQQSRDERQKDNVEHKKEHTKILTTLKNQSEKYKKDIVKRDIEFKKYLKELKKQTERSVRQAEQVKQLKVESMYTKQVLISNNLTA